MSLPAPETVDDTGTPKTDSPETDAEKAETPAQTPATCGLKMLDEGENADADAQDAASKTPESPQTQKPTPAKPAAAKPVNVEKPPETVAEKVETACNFDSALQILALLQREGRFIDFLQEDVGAASDADVGAAARVVHNGCKKALKDYINIKPLRSEQEGDPITLEPGFDPRAVRLTGKILGEPPFHGHLAHPGWRVTRIELPPLAEGQDAAIVAPAEVDL